MTKIVEHDRLVRMAIRSQSYCLLSHQERLVHVTEIPEALVAAHKRIAEIAEDRGFAGTIRSQSYCLLKYQDGLVHVAEIPKAVEATQKGITEIGEP
jgi:hypothetical protein